MSERLAYFEWSAPKGADLGDPVAWAQANPALGIRINEEFIHNERDAIGDDEFARERIGLWQDETTLSPIPHEAWAEVLDATSQASGQVMLGLAVSDDGSSWSCIGVAGPRADGLTHVELVDNRRGTGWVVAELERLAREHRATVVVGKSTAAGGLVGDLEAAGVPLRLVGPSEVAQASVRFAADVRERKLRHIGQPAVDMAVERARVRSSGDLWRFAGSNGADISPLSSVVLAAWGASQAPASTPVFVW